MKRTGLPSTMAVRFLKERDIPFTPHSYTYVERGGTAEAARSLGVEEHAVVKTLVFSGEDRTHLLVLMHGDREVSTRELARQTGGIRIAPADPAHAERVTGYRVGGISPFGTLRPLPVFVESSILALPRVFVNGGRRGFLVEVNPSVIPEYLDAKPVSVAIVP